MSPGMLGSQVVATHRTPTTNTKPAILLISSLSRCRRRLPNFFVRNKTPRCVCQRKQTAAASDQRKAKRERGERCRGSRRRRTTRRSRRATPTSGSTPRFAPLHLTLPRLFRRVVWVWHVPRFRLRIPALA
jgi:hypothetical protein